MEIFLQRRDTENTQSRLYDLRKNLKSQTASIKDMIKELDQLVYGMDFNWRKRMVLRDKALDKFKKLYQEGGADFIRNEIIQQKSFDATAKAMEAERLKLENQHNEFAAAVKSEIGAELYGDELALVDA